MLEYIKKHERLFLVLLIVIFMGFILLGGLGYIEKLRQNLQSQAIQNVFNVTLQQQIAFDNFVSGDRERLHSYADFFATEGITDPKDIQRQLMMFKDADAICAVMCIDDGWFCSDSVEDIRQVEAKSLAVYRNLEGSGVRDAYVGLFSGTPKFGYYENFTFSNGHRGLIQKSYDRNAVSESFSLSFYNGEGFVYVLDQDGNILLRSVHMSNNRVYDNVYDALAASRSDAETVAAFMDMLTARTAGSTIFSGDNGEYVYAYVPLNSVDGWSLLSIVPMDAIAAETNQMLRNSQVSLLLLLLVLAICSILLMLIWRSHKDIEAQKREVAYQSQLFEIFISYISRNTDDVYIMMNHITDALEYVSPNLERVLGVDAENAISFMENDDMAKDPEAANAYYNEVVNLRPGQITKTRRTERINPKTGDLQYFLENAYCVDIQGKLKRVCYISDRTKEQKAHNSITEALRMAEAANEAKSSFLSSVSHDIRTPMNAIIGFLALMQEEAGNPAMVMEYTQRIDAASQHLLGLINDVLDMNKIESGSATLNISEINLADIIDEINSIIRPQAKAKEQTFDITVSHMVYEHLMGDKLRINQILINLLSNAVKYTPIQGHIQMRVEELPQVVNNYSRVRFTVADNGLGMSPEYLKVIFDPFTREETEITSQIQGTGLGMAITKSLVDLMGGVISVESELGQGSTFVVELELFIQEREDDPKFWANHSVAKMIVADDDEEVCHNIVKMMVKTGVVVDYSTDGQTAINMMRSAREAGEPYDLILLDWKMPNLNGLETARLIRKNYPDKIPILLLTAYDWSDIEQEAIEIGINHFMPKPFFMSTFKDAIRRVMGRPATETAASEKSDVVKDMNIMVVDDIDVNRIILVKILTGLGARCEVAANGQEALDMFKASQPGKFDLILMDVQMPVMNGYEATRAIRASSHPEAKSMPIIAMTANAFVDDVRDAIDSGMDAHIAKPVQLDKLKSTIKQVLQQKKGEE